MNSTGAFKQQKYFVTTTPIIGDQWIAQYSAVATYPSRVQVSSGGEAYILWQNTVIKLNTSGNKTFAIDLSVFVDVFCSMVDSNNNVYVGGLIDNVPGIIKYDSLGNLIWEKTFGTGVYRPIVSIQVATNGDVFCLAGVQPPVTTYSNPCVVWKLDSNGNVINQRKVLKAASTSTTYVQIDNTNSKLYITGSDFSSGRSEVLTGTYDLTNTDTASGIVYQSSTVDKYYTNNYGYTNCTLVYDATYFYQVCSRYITSTGILHSVFVKINKSTGAISYSKELVISGVASTISGIVTDNNGFIYVYGNVSGGDDSGPGFIAKISTSTGNVVWCKKLGSSTQLIWDVAYSNGFLYINSISYVSGYHSACIKMNVDGSLPNGTYGTYWTFTATTPTLVTYNAASTGTTTGTNSTTAYSVTTPSYTTSTSSATITTTYIP